MLRTTRPALATALAATAIVLGLLVDRFAQANEDKKAEGLQLSECLVLPPVGRAGRAAVLSDALDAKLATGQWTAPKAGDEARAPGGEARKWTPLKVAANGSFEHAGLRGGYAYFAVPSERERIVLLEAAGHGMLYVNGEPRAGDPYEHGYVRLPILLKKGAIELLFHVGRGSLRVKLSELGEREPATAVRFNTSDLTLPDLVAGQKVDAWAAVVVLNITTETLSGVTLQTGPGESLHTVTAVPPIPPLGVRKVGFRLTGPGTAEPGQVTVRLQLMRDVEGRMHVLDQATVQLESRPAGQTHRRTFISEIDGSVQYFAVVPAKPDKPSDDKPGLVLTLHGAAVEALGQANAYAAKPWCHIVAPTNRRPYGFDWEDWGRLDALEVLHIAQRELAADPRRIYLTGHSMGGHGAWHLGVTYPDRFAAVGPSAGWISMWSYAGARRPENPDPLQEMLLRAASASDTLALARNLSAAGVYILHGEKDDNVPVQQARIMRKHLGEFHQDFAYHEEAGKGHWWSLPSPPHVGGAACVDWPPMFEFFARHTLPKPAEVRQVEFTTASPGVSAWCHWAGIEAQHKAFTPSSLSLRHDPDERSFAGKTENVARLALDVGHAKPGKPIRVELDGQKLEPIPWPADGKRIWLVKSEGGWRSAPKPAASLKGPHRYGPFKEAFRNRVLFVYGTQGTPEENAWALAKARYDAETFWYRGNGAVDVVSDLVFDPSVEQDRNLVLYGNAKTNKAWNALLSDSPVQMTPGRVRLGERELAGEDLACLFVRPRPGSDRALIGVVSGSGLAGMKLTNRLPYFVSGVGYPDCLILGSESFTQGAAGVRVAGFFGTDWSVKTGEFAWRDK